MITMQELVKYTNNEIKNNIQSNPAVKGCMGYLEDLGDNNKSILKPQIIKFLNDPLKVVIVVEILEDLIENDLNSKFMYNPRFGICMNLNAAVESQFTYDFTSLGYSIVTQLGLGWPKHSGDPSYPILLESKGEGSSRWSGNALEMRKDLCRYLVAKIKELSIAYSKSKNGAVL